MELDIEIVDGGIPLLIGLEIMKRYGLILDFDDNIVRDSSGI